MMKSLHLTVIISFHLLLLSVSTSSSLVDICGAIELFKLCGRGTCHVNASAAYGYDCACEPGWRSLQLPNYTFPSCSMPNCTVDFQCGSGVPPPPPPPPPPLPANGTDINACSYMYCAEGTCNPNSNPIKYFDVTCKCPEGTANLNNDPHLPCFKYCYLGGNCNKNLLSPTPSPSSSSGTNDAPSNSRSILRALIMILCATFFLTRF